VEYDSTDSKLVCYTPAAPGGAEGAADVRVSVLTINSEQQYAACPTPSACRFTYGWGQTPKVDAATLGGAPGAVYRATGQLYGDGVDVYHVRIGGATCTVDEAVQAGNAGDLMDWSGSGTVRCVLGDAEAGRYNVSLEARDTAVAGQGWGQAAWRGRQAKQVAPDGTVFHFTARPRVDALSFSATGLAGGSVLTITGAGFSTRGDNAVTLAGVPCAVVDATPTAIRCRPGTAAASSPAMAPGVLYPGGAGLVHAIFRDRNAWPNDPEAAGVAPSSVAVNGGGLATALVNEADLYAQVLKGFFVPPVSANYTFYTRGDDQVGVWLSTDASPARARSVAGQTGWAPSFWHTPGQLSAPLWLEAGQPYYIRVQHQEGWGGDWFEVAVRVHTEGNAAAAAALTSAAQTAFRSVPQVTNVALTAAVTREKQLITVTGAGGGMWGVRVPGVTLTNADAARALAFDATASAVQTALAGAAGCGAVRVTRSAHTAPSGAAGFAWEVTWDCPVASAGTTWPLIEPFSVSLSPAAGGGGGAAAVAAARIATASAPLDGTFALEWRGTPTAPLAFSASAGDVQAALLAVDGIGAVEVSALYGADPRDGRTWQVTIWAPAGDHPQLVALTAPDASSGVGLTGPTPGATVTVVQRGSLDPFLWPVPADWLRTATPLPGVVVTSNGILAVCDSFRFNATGASANATVLNPACTFVYDDALTPTVASVSPTTAVPGDTLTVTGTGFLPAAAGVGAGPRGGDLSVSALNAVFVGDALCTVTAATLTQLTCTLDDGPAGTHAVRVEVGLGHGFAADGGAPPTVAVPTVIDAAAPLSGSRAGGTALVITGSGFVPGAGNNTVTVGGAPCAEVSATASEIVCTTPPGTSATAAVIVNGEALAGASFNYASALTATVTAVSPSQLSSATSNYVNVTLAGVPAGADLAVAFGPRPCRVTDVVRGAGGAARVTCLLVRAPAADAGQGPFPPAVTVSGAGLADAAGASLDTRFRVTAISPATGSMEGGTLVNITGFGFTGRKAATAVAFVHIDPVDPAYIHHVDCRVRDIAPDGRSLTCVAGKPGEHVLPESDGTIIGRLEVSVNKLAAPCDTPATCAYTYTNDVTSVVTSFAVSAAGVATLTGSNLLPPMHVWFGTTMADDEAVTVSVDATTVTVARIPRLAAGTVGVYAHSVPRGNVRMAATHTYGLGVARVAGADGAAARGSVAGGTPVVIAGAGFASSPSRNTVFFAGGYAATVLTANESHLTVLTPSVVGAGVVATGGTASVPLSVSVLDAVTGMPLATTNVSDAFTYDDTAAWTPTVTRVTPTRAAAGTPIRITGTGFGAVQPARSGVVIGGVECAVDAATWTATTFNCTLGGTPAGVHRVLVTVGSAGLARTTAAVTVAAAVTGVSPSAIGVGGGAPLTVSGAGFAPDGSGGSNAVVVCGVPCDVTAATGTAITCVPRAVPTAAALDAFRTYEPVVLAGTPSGTSPSSAPAAFDGSPETGFRSCTVGLDLGPGTRGLVTRVRFYPRFRATAQFAGSVFAGSADGATWTTLTTIGGTASVLEGWNYVDLVPGGGAPPGPALGATLAPLRYLRWTAATGSDCTGNEVQFIGFPVAAVDAGGRCGVNVTVTAPRNAFSGTPVAVNAALPAATGVRVDAGVTPSVTRIAPTWGTALGGDVVTVYGAGFPAGVPGDVAVAFNGVPCTVTAVNASAVTCITGVRTTIAPPSVSVVVAGAGVAVYNVSTTYFRYLDRWSAVTTWADQEPPVEGDTVIVPAGQAILVDVSPPRLFLVLVQGELVFDRRDLTFDAHYIVVHGGRFEVGTEAEPFTHRAVITLHGDRYDSIEIPEVGAKVLAVMNRGVGHETHADDHSSSHSMDAGDASDVDAVMALVMSDMMGTDHGMDMSAALGVSASATDSSPLAGLGAMHGDMPGVAGAPPAAATTGYLDIHGAPRKRVWTKVAATVPAGTTVITTAEDVDWAPGETIVITAGSWNYAEAEEAVVALRPDARTVVVAEPLAYTHTSRLWSAAAYGHGNVDLRCEVGLLSRNVVIRGAPGSEAQAFGVHTGAFHGGVYRLENAELTQCGQSNNLGRYCSHYHMHGDAPYGYIRSNSIHHSFQRAVTIHGTAHMTVAHNFAYHIRGHSIFVEDGVERWNVIEGNLVAVTLRCFACLKSDTKPASFWAASPTNFWRSNVAAGSQNDGFWLEPPGNPHGPSFTTSYCPVGAPLGQFWNNTAHSNGVHGLRIYPVYTPYVDPCRPESGPLAQHFHNFTSWRNGQHGIFGKQNGDLHHVNPKLVENRGDEFFQIKYVGGVGYTDDPNLKDALLVATVDPAALPPWDKRAVWAPQNEYWLVDGATVVNYAAPGAQGALAGCAECDSQTEYRQGGYTYRWRRLAFHNTPVRTFWAPPRRDIFWDMDGTLTGQRGGGWVLPRYRFNDWPECPPDTSGVFSGGSVCTAAVQVRRLQIDGVLPRELDFQTLNVSSTAGFDDVTFRPKEFYGWAAPVVNRRWYGVRFKSAVDWRTLRLRYSEPEYIVPGEWTGTTWSWIDYRHRIRATYRGVEVDPLPAGALPGPGAVLGTGTMPAGPANNTWPVIFTTNTNGTDPMTDKARAYAVEATAIQCPPRGCSPPPDSDLGPPVLWSDPATWGGAVPAPGADVTINATVHVVMDVNPPRLGRVTILGRLEFQDSGARVLEAASVVVWGSLIVGTPAAPFLNAAEIVLVGTRTSPTVVVDNQLFVGNKVLLALGRVSLVGAPRAVTWGRLAAPVAAGATSIRMATSVAGAWRAGDSIVVTPTEYDHTQVETATIASVSADGLTVSLAAPLAFNHWAGAAGASGPTARVTLSAAVGLLTRNVVVRGDLSGAADTYGGHMFVSAVVRTTGGVRVVREGSLDARGVEFRGMGQGGMEHAAVTFQFGAFDLDSTVIPDASEGLANNGINSLVGCAFSSTFNYGVVATHARNLVIDGNVFHRTLRNGVDIDKDSGNATITRNLFAGNFKSPDVNAPDQTPWVWPQAAVFLNTQPRALANNYVGGAYDAAFTLRADDCAASAARSFMRGNEAAGVLIGVFILPTRTASGCALVTGFTVWKAAHVGILAVDGLGDLTVSSSVVADSHIGMSFNFVVSKKGEGRSTVRDSVIIGSSRATTGGAGASGCAASTTCRAMTPEDVAATGRACGSVLGGGWRRAGLMLPQYTNRGKTCEVDGGLDVCRPVNRPERLCGMPWENRFGLPSTRNTHMYVNNVTFSAFAGFAGDCGLESRAVVVNPTQTDMAVPVTGTQVTWDGVAENARFWFGTTDATNGKCADGVGCDGANFVIIRDGDGSVTGVRGTTITGNSPALADPSPVCTWKAAWPGAVCQGTLRAAVIENMDRDRGHRKLGAFTATRVVEGPPAANRTVSAMGPVDDNCAKRFYFGQYPFVVRPGTTVDIAFPSTEPGQTRIHFLSPDPTEKVVLRMFIQRPNSLDIFLDGTKVPQKNLQFAGDRPTLADPAGSNLFDPQARTLTLTLAGSTHASLGAGTVWYDVVRSPSVQLTLKLSVSPGTFYGPALVSNLALLLDIDPSRIKVVAVAPADSILGRRLQGAPSAAATEVKVEILPPPGATVLVVDPDDNATAAAVVEDALDMVDLADVIDALATSGDLQTQLGAALGYAVGAVEVEAPVIAAAAPDDTGVPLTPADSSRDGVPSGTIAGIALGILAAVLIGGGVMVLMQRTKLRAVVAAEALARRPGQGLEDPAFSAEAFVVDNPQYGHTGGVETPVQPPTPPPSAPAPSDPPAMVAAPSPAARANAAFAPGARSSVRVGVAPVPAGGRAPAPDNRPRWRL
jgi:hypothetical protein